ncbi:MAG: hypothetical protein AB7S38_37000 [Vulcanimicrobiota bacterium]
MTWYDRQMGKKRGVSVGTTLLAVSLVAVLGFTLASLSVTHLSLTTREANSLQAHNLARSAVRQAMASILEQRSFGLNGTAAENLTVRLEGSQGTGRLTFHRDVAEDWRIPVSVNNIQGTASVEGGQAQIVPVAAAHLVGVGESGGVVATVEAILVVPPFPFAIASGGPIVSRGSVLIAGLPAGTEPTLDLTQLDPADLLTNDTSNHSVQLGADTTVAGDIQSAGQVVLDDPTVKVLGEIRSQASPEKIPTLQAEQFDPAALGMAYDTLGDNSLGQQGDGQQGDGQQPTHLSGAVRSNHSVRFRKGLELDGATLFIDGDLVVEGGLKGSGVVVVKGKTTISGGTSLDTENQVAILSEGDIDLTGVGPMSSRFQGLLYTDGGLRAEQISLVGTLVARGERGVRLADTYVFVEKRAVTEQTESLPRGNWTFDLSGPGYIGQGGGAPLPDEIRGPQPPLQVDIQADGQQFFVTFTPGPSGTFTDVKGLRTFIQANIIDPAMAKAILSQVLAGMTLPGVHYVDGTGLVSMEPSQFLKAEEDIRLALWRER